jgi:hypothetical protein
MEAFMAYQNSVHPVKAILISNYHSHNRNMSLVALVWLIAAMVSATFCQIASAQNQQYAALEVAEKYRVQLAPYDADDAEISVYKKDNRDSERNQRESLAKVKAILNSNGNIADPIVSEYFDGFEFPSMTTLDERVLSKLGERRTKFIKDYLNSNVTGNARNGLIDLTIAATQKICADSSLHPAARLNAVYLMGILDQVAPIRNPVQLPVPSKAAFDSLRRILDSADAKSFPEYLKVAALAGIQRHVEIDRLVGGQITAANKQALLQKAKAFLDEQKTDDLSYWLKRRGMQLIGLIGDPGSIDRVLAVLKSEDAEFWLRFDALEAIGKLKLSSDALAKNLEAAVAITEYLASSFENESKSIEESVEELVHNQLLFENIDLVETGTNYERNEPAQTGSAFTGGDGFGASGGGRSGGGAGGSGKFSGGGMGAGMGAGGGGPPGGAPGGGFGFGAGAGNSGGTPQGMFVELPVYQLNIIRRRIKALAFTGTQILGGSDGTEGLSKLIDENGQTFVAKVVQDLNNALNESNAGIIDLEARKKKTDDEPMTDEEPIGVTQQLINLCAKSAKTLNGFVRTQKGEPEVDPADAAVGAPAVPAAGDKPDS